VRRTARLSRTRSVLRSITVRAFLAVVLAILMAWGSLTLADVISPSKVSPPKTDSISLTSNAKAPSITTSRHRRRHRRGYPPRRRGCERGNDDREDDRTPRCDNR
jgi:hypothetical protein